MVHNDTDSDSDSIHRHPLPRLVRTNVPAAETAVVEKKGKKLKFSEFVLARGILGGIFTPFSTKNIIHH